MAAPAGGQSQPAVQLPQVASSSPRLPHDSDPSRIRTKGEQKSFDPRNAGGGKLEFKPDPESLYPANREKPNHLQTKDASNDRNVEKSGTEALKASNLENDSKLSTNKEEEENKSDQALSANKSLEPGKAALAVKLQKKLQHAESMESLIAKKENIPENILPKEELPVEDEWDKGFSKLMEDLAANPEGVTSKKCRNLGRKYMHKVQIQNAIDKDLIVPPTALVEEEEEESEPEAPVKFRGKFKSIKDKKVERLILTYASHSDESAVDMIPDDDASDFEEELEREIRLKSKKRGHTKKKVLGDSSSDSEAEKVGRKRGSRGTKENKLNIKQDSDYSISSSVSASDTSDSDRSDSDTEESEVELVTRSRKGKRSDNEKPKSRRKWQSESSESEEEKVPIRTRRRGRKYSSDEESFKPSQRNTKRRKKQDDSSDSDEIPKKTTKTRRGRKRSDSDEDEDEVVTRRGKNKSSVKKKYKQEDDSDEDSESEVPRKTRGMKKKIQESKKGRRRKISSSESEEVIENRKGTKKTDGRRNTKSELNKVVEDSSEDSDIPTKKKNSAKANVIVDSDDSESNSKNDNLKEKEPSQEESKLVDEEHETVKKETAEETDLPEDDYFEEIVDEDENKEPDSVTDKLEKIKAEENSREDVQEMKVWLGEMNRDIEKQLNKLKDVTLRNNWKRPQFGGGEDFFHGWQSEVKKYKSGARFPKKLCLATKHQGVVTPSKSSPRKLRDQELAKESPKRCTSSPAKNTRSKSGIIKTSLAVAEDDKLKVAARPEISSVMQRFFDKVLAESGGDSSKEESSSKKFTLGPFTSYGAQRVPTGLTPTPSVAPSMMASDDSDLDSLESVSLKMDRPKSDITVYKRCIVNRLLKKIKPKYNDKKLNTFCHNKTRNILEVTNKPQLLPTPGMPTSEKELEEMSPSQIKNSRFFRKETVENYRSNFEVIVTKNGINEFTPILYESRTRNKTKQIQDAATVKSVFGYDIPPHVLKKAEEKKSRKLTKKVEKDKKEDTNKKDESLPVPVSRSSTPGGSALAAGDDEDDSKLRSERSGSVLGEPSVTLVPKKVKRKFRRRRDGFEYAPKKKKVKPDDKKPSRKRLVSLVCVHTKHSF